jgi:hypothetical protein
MAQFYVIFCGAGSSPTDVSTAVARVFGSRPAALTEVLAQHMSLGLVEGSMGGLV